MTNDELLHLLSRQLDHELSADDKLRLDAHLRESPEARTIAEAFRVQDRELKEEFVDHRLAAAELAGAISAKVPVKTLPPRPLSPKELRRREREMRREDRGMISPWWIAGGALALTLLITGVLFVYTDSGREDRRQIVQVGPPPTFPIIPPRTPISEMLQPKALPPELPVSIARTGQEIETKEGQRLRFSLPNGTVVLLNQLSTLWIAADGVAGLTRGEAFVDMKMPAPSATGGMAGAGGPGMGMGMTPAEAAPAIGAPAPGPFRIGVAPPANGPTVFSAPGRLFNGTTGRYLARVNGNQTSLTVASGSVVVSGSTVDGFPTAPVVTVTSGERLAPGSDEPAMATDALAELDWTRELIAESETPLVPKSKHGAGSLVAVDPSGQEAKLALEKFHIDVHIEDGFARTTIDQTYFNNENFEMEGTFFFPLPPDASLSRLAMYVNGKLMEGGMAEKNHARNTYEQIRYSRRDPALLEWVDGSTFKMRVFPLEARQQKRIVLSYTQKLDDRHGRSVYRFPAGHTMSFVEDWSFASTVVNSKGYEITSPSHRTMKIAANGEDQMATDSTKSARLDRDVVLEIRDPAAAADKKEGVRWSSFSQDDKHYRMLRYRPTLPSGKKVETRNWVFLLETHGTRDPLLARTQIEIVRRMLENANQNDTFSVSTANTKANTPGNGPAGINPDSVGAAMDWLDKSHLIGALDLEAGFAACANAINPAAPESNYLVHIGSGLPSMGEQRVEELLTKIPAGMKYVGIGVGKKYNELLMRKAAEKTGGFHTTIQPDEGIIWRTFELATSLNVPRLQNVQVKPAEGTTKWLTMRRTVQNGEEVVAICQVDREKDLPAKVTVGGTLDGKPFSKTLDLGVPADKAGYLPRAWAKLEIDRLLTGREPNEHPSPTRVIELSKQMYVMSPYTSLLVLENEQMYKDFNVDRGRKDHWAMYPCPEKIEVIYRPDPNQPVGRGPDAAGRRVHENEVMQTVMVRTAPRWLRHPSIADDNTIARTAGQARSSGVQNGRTMLGRIGSLGNDGVVNFWGEMDVKALGDTWEFRSAGGIRSPSGSTKFAMLKAGGGNAPDGENFFVQGVELGLQLHGSININTSDVFAIDEAIGTPMALSDSTVADSRSLIVRGTNRREDLRMDRFAKEFAENSHVLFNPVPPSDNAPRSLERMFRNTGMRGNRAVSLSDLKEVQQSLGDLDDLPAEGDPEAQEPGRARTRLSVRGLGLRRMAAPVYAQWPPALYQSVGFNDNRRLYTDLLSYAPGMSSSDADIRAAVEAEATPKANRRLGSVDPEARKLLESARNADDWRKIIHPNGDTITYDYTGRYVETNTLHWGLKEIVVCDGETLRHFYPEIGVGAVRKVSRFHREAHRARIADMAPKAEDLVIGFDLKRISPEAVARVPHRTPEAVAAKTPWVEEHFRIENGKLVRHDILKMPAPEMVGRVEFFAEGRAKVFDRFLKSKEIDLPKTERAAEPDLAPDARDLVVLELPLRERSKVYRDLGMDANQSLTSGENACHEYLSPEAILRLIACEIAADRGDNVSQLIEVVFRRNGDYRVGLLTILASVQQGAYIPRDMSEWLEKQPESPVVRHFAHLTLPLYQWLGARAVVWNPEASAKGFVPALAKFQILHQRVLKANENPLPPWYRVTDAEEEKIHAFVREHAADELGWTLAAELRNRVFDERPVESARRVVTRKALLDKAPKSYFARAEYADALSRVAESKVAAADEFEKLFVDSVKAGFLPPIDARFRNGMDNAKPDGFRDFVRTLAKLAIKEKQSPIVVRLAAQANSIGNPEIAEELLRMVLPADPVPPLPGMPGGAGMGGFAGSPTMAMAQPMAPGDNLFEKAEVYASAVEHYSSVGDDRKAAECVERMIGELQQRDAVGPWAYRRATEVADRRGRTLEAIKFFETALDMEYKQLPDVVDVQKIRNDYGRLLSHYEWLSEASIALSAPAPGDLLARLVRCADRWRQFDAEQASAICNRTAKILRDQRGTEAGELAWNYLTTPVALQPGESAPWLALAVTLIQKGDSATADSCYRQAFAVEPTNPEILRDHAKMHERFGQAESARQTMQQIIDGKWQPRFEPTVKWATGRVRGE